MTQEQLQEINAIHIRINALEHFFQYKHKLVGKRSGFGRLHLEENKDQYTNIHPQISLSDSQLQVLYTLLQQELDTLKSQFSNYKVC